ncbi:DNA adenine methylase, partial [Halorubrum sp. SD683]|uniref:DNA adenine methylase n=1 Tax=Halorubrum sp. SD683 TaxID=1855873 RepID=UPI000A2D5DE4
MAEPILKWAGGKRQLLDQLYARFPAQLGRYHGPFVGGGAVFFDVEPARATVNDANPRRVNFYEQVRDRPEELIARLASFDDPESDP